MDFIGRLEKAKGLYTILVVVDWLAKYSYFIGLSHHPFIANDIAVMFHLRVLFSPIVLESPVFLLLRKSWKDLFLMAGTQLVFIIAYYLQTDNIQRWSVNMNTNWRNHDSNKYPRT